MIGWLYDFAYGQDVQVFDANSMTTRIGGEKTPSSLGWYFWNGQLDKHELFDLHDLRWNLSMSIDEIRALIGGLTKITYFGSR